MTPAVAYTPQVIPGRGWVGAKAQGEQLKAQGDAFVGGVDAYSTLGFFADPILNAFLRHSDAELAELIFAVPMNNARLNTVATYFDQVPTLRS